MSMLQNVLDKIDEANRLDPNKVEHQGNESTKELLYSQRMTNCLHRFHEDPPETLQIAVRAQHIERWKLSRQDYPPGREGYNKWRKDQALHHSELTASLMEESGYLEETINTVRNLLTKKNLKNDPDVQTLEDVACLVFLEHYFEDFAGKHTEEKLITILKKTWGKMSEQGHRAALELPLSSIAKDTVAKALNGGSCR